MEQGDRYICQCPERFTGEQCETPIRKSIVLLLTERERQAELNEMFPHGASAERSVRRMA